MHALEIGLLTIAVIALWSKFAPKKLKVLPAPLIAVLIAATDGHPDISRHP